MADGGDPGAPENEEAAEVRHLPPGGLVLQRSAAVGRWAGPSGGQFLGQQDRCHVQASVGIFHILHPNQHSHAVLHGKADPALPN